MADHSFIAPVDSFTDEIRDQFEILVSPLVGGSPLNLTGWTVDAGIWDAQPVCPVGDPYPAPDYTFTQSGTTTRLLVLTEEEKLEMGCGPFWYSIVLVSPTGVVTTYQTGNLTWRP